MSLPGQCCPCIRQPVTHDPSLNSWRGIGFLQQIRGEPALHGGNVHPLARGVVFHLIVVNLPHGEVFSLGWAKYRPLTDAAGIMANVSVR